MVTDHQTAGRGRQSRAWHDEPGNAMLMSVLLRPALDVAPMMPLVAGLAVTDAVGSLLATSHGQTAEGAALKWPNDVLVPSLAERKLAGILAEATTDVGPDAPSPLAVVVGMGLNVRWSSPPPPEIEARAATLEELAGAPIDRWTVANAVLVALDRWFTAVSTEGAPVVLDAYRLRCLTLGRKIRLQTPGGEIEGTATSIADDGGLVVETDAGPVTVLAGDAHHI